MTRPFRRGALAALRQRQLWLAVLGVAVAMTHLGARPRDYVTRVWTTNTFPERTDRKLPADVGVAFSGGGTRSAAATLGQLRALRKLGWLPKIGYVSAVSGGSWAAVPFTFTDDSLDDRLLGFQPDFDALTPARLVTTPDGSLAQAISHSRLLTCATLETSSILGLLSPDTERTIAQLTGRCSYGDADSGTYARLLDSVFLRHTTTVKNGSLMAWDRLQLDEILSVNPSLARSQFTLAGERRPFLIASATVIHGGAGRRELLPIEMTPLYTGVRRHRSAIGGTYLWSWAFDSQGAEAIYPGAAFLRVLARSDHQGLTPADMMASSGAAPVLEILARSPANLVDRVTAYFPHFTHVTLRDGVPEPPQRALLHGDGGFLDNDGLMPLLARNVHNIIVFVNTKDSLAGNADILSYFRQPAGSATLGAKVNNVVFAKGDNGEDRYDEIVAQLKMQVSAGRGAVACGRNWKVVANDTYGIEPYDGLNICFVYNYHAYSWWEQLPDHLKFAIVPPRTAFFTGREVAPKGSGEFKDFPWYRTFFENAATLVNLTAAQVNVLAHLSCWTVEDQRESIESALPVLKARLQEQE